MFDFNKTRIIWRNSEIRNGFKPATINRPLERSTTLPERKITPVQRFTEQTPGSPEKLLVAPKIKEIITEAKKPLTFVFENPTSKQQLSLTEQVADLKQAYLTYYQLLKIDLQPQVAQKVVTKALKAPLLQATFETSLKTSPRSLMTEQKIKQQLLDPYKLTIFKVLKVRKITEVAEFVRDEDLNKQRLQAILKAADEADGKKDAEGQVVTPNILDFLPSDSMLRSQVAKEYDGSLANIKQILAQTQFRSLSDFNFEVPSLIKENSAIKIEVNSPSQPASPDEVKKVFEGIFYLEELQPILTRLLISPQQEVNRLTGRTNLQAA